MAAVNRTYRQGDTIFKEGEHSSSLFLVKRGVVSVRKIKGSEFVEIARVYKNQVIGELSFFDRRPRSATAVADGEVELVEIDFHSLDQLWAQVPDYLKSIMMAVAERLRKANDTIRRLKVDPTGSALAVEEAEPDVSAGPGSSLAGHDSKGPQEAKTGSENQ